MAARGAIGSTCVQPGECDSGLCGGSVCLDPGSDDDGDGLLNGIEVGLGTSPLDADSDGDGQRDEVEVGGSVQAPADSDGDGIIDALESGIEDVDDDCLVDELDDHDGIANVPSETRPEACGNGAYVGDMTVCRLLNPALAGTCAAPVGEAFACFDGVRPCVLRAGPDGATQTYANKAVWVYPSTLIASSGEACVGAGGFDFNDETGFSHDSEGVTCPGGEQVTLEPELRTIIRFCFQGGNGCPGG